jgi:phospholipid-translocating ATPase
LVEDEEAEKAILYVRGSDESMRSLIHFENGSSEYESALNFNKINGLKSFIFASKEITIEEAKVFQQEFNAAKRTNLDQDLKLYNLAKKLETNLNFEAIVGFENTLREGAETTVEMLLSQGLKVHILSGDNLEHCLQTAQQLKLIGNGINSGYHHIDFDSEDIGRGQIKRVLDMIRKTVVRHNIQTNSTMRMTLKTKVEGTPSETQTTNSNDINIVVSGSTVDYITGNQYLREHFMFILYFANTVVGYDFSTMNKAQLVSMFKSIDKKTMSIGDGYNDILMLKEADVGIQVASNNVGYIFGDILVNSLTQIPKCLSMSCRDWNNNLSQVIHSLFMFTAIMSFVDLIFQPFVHFSGDSLFTSYFLVFSFVGAIPISLNYIFSERYVSESTRSKFPGFYCEKNFLNKLLDVRIITYHIVVMANPDSRGSSVGSDHLLAVDLQCK